MSDDGGDHGSSGGGYSCGGETDYGSCGNYGGDYGSYGSCGGERDYESCGNYGGENIDVDVEVTDEEGYDITLDETLIDIEKGGNKIKRVGKVKVLADDGQFESELSSAGSKLVVVNFTASWCPPCKRIAPFYDQLSAKYSEAVFLKVSLQRVYFLLSNFLSVE